MDSKSGRAPNHGSNDGTDLLPLSGCEYGDFRPLVSLGSGVLGRSGTLQAGPWDEIAVWFYGRSPQLAKSEPAGPRIPVTIASAATILGHWCERDATHGARFRPINFMWTCGITESTYPGMPEHISTMATRRGTTD